MIDIVECPVLNRYLNNILRYFPYEWPLKTIQKEKSFTTNETIKPISLCKFLWFPWPNFNLLYI